MDYVKDILYFFYYKFMLPKHIHIGKTARIINTGIRECGYLEVLENSIISQSKLAKKIIIEKNCLIKYSTLNGYNRICDNSVIRDSEIGEFTYITRESWFHHVKTGKFCSIGSRVIAGRGIHPSNYLSTSPFFYSSEKQTVISLTDKALFNQSKEIIIGNDVWIGDNVFILDGVNIGNGAIIGAGAIVTRDVPPYSIFGGNPAKLIRFRFAEERIREIESMKWWDWSLEKLQNNAGLFQVNISEKNAPIADLIQ